MKGHTTGEECAKEVTNVMINLNLAKSKLAGICTDGCPSMVGAKNGAVKLIIDQIGDDQEILQYHCVIHNHVLCGKVLKYDHVMKIVVKIVNLIRSRNLNHRLFREFLEKTEADHEDLLYHTDVRWLSRGLVLDRFISLLPEIRTFLPTRQIDFPDLTDPAWLSDLAFLADITGMVLAFLC
jgi:hypothetical protein